MEGGQAGHHAGGALSGCGCAALQHACHGPQLHAVVRDGWVSNISRSLLLLLQAHGGDASAEPHRVGKKRKSNQNAILLHDLSCVLSYWAAHL